MGLQSGLIWGGGAHPKAHPFKTDPPVAASHYSRQLTISPLGAEARPPEMPGGNSPFRPEGGIEPLSSPLLETLLHMGGCRLTSTAAYILPSIISKLYFVFKVYSLMTMFTNNQKTDRIGESFVVWTKIRQ